MSEGIIYFIGCEPLEAVKIGFTKHDPYARLAGLQTANPAPLKMLAFVRGSLDEEHRLHQAFTPLRIHREWFRLEYALQDFVWYLQKHEDQAREADRGEFLNALHDCVMQSVGWHPSMPISDDEYSRTCSWEPFREELWNAFGPWDE